VLGTLSAGDAVAVWKVINSAAYQAKKAATAAGGDKRSIGEIRAHAMADLILGRLPHPENDTDAADARRDGGAGNPTDRDTTRTGARDTTRGSTPDQAPAPDDEATNDATTEEAATSEAAATDDEAAASEAATSEAATGVGARAGRSPGRAAGASSSGPGSASPGSFGLQMTVNIGIALSEFLKAFRSNDSHNPPCLNTPPGGFTLPGTENMENAAPTATTTPAGTTAPAATTAPAGTTAPGGPAGSAGATTSGRATAPAGSTQSEEAGAPGEIDGVPYPAWVIRDLVQEAAARLQAARPPLRRGSCARLAQGRGDYRVQSAMFVPPLSPAEAEPSVADPLPGRIRHLDRTNRPPVRHRPARLPRRPPHEQRTTQRPQRL
jgi:probable phosphoglycerate mutase